VGVAEGSGEDVTDKERVDDSDLEEDRVKLMERLADLDLEGDFVCERVFVVDRELDLLFDCVLDRDVDVEEDRDSDIDFDNDRLRVGEEFAFDFNSRASGINSSEAANGIVSVVCEVGAPKLNPSSAADTNDMS
jgi:hypothetical protein